jgi:hypothetical protein
MLPSLAKLLTYSMLPSLAKLLTYSRANFSSFLAVDASQVPNKGRRQKSSTPKATSPVTGGRGSKRVLAPPQEVPRLTRQRARELSAANPVEGTQEDSTQVHDDGKDHICCC